MEQAAYSMAVPAQTLLMATGRFGRAGGATMACALISVLLTVALMPAFGALGFAVASLAGTAVGLVPALLALEWTYWRERGQRPSRVVGPRLAIALAAAATGPLMRWSPLAANVYLLAVLAVAAVQTHRLRSAAVIAAPDRPRPAA
jgi:O-antigen/teichoic acid export membrane protein